jgi:hypothetical protein
MTGLLSWTSANWRPQGGTRGKSQGNVGYNPMADFDRNNIINIFDFGLLATNYLKMSPVEVP